MLSVNKINSNISYRSNAKYVNNFNNTEDTQKAYLEMNKDCRSFVDGDISFCELLKDKLSNFWNIAFNEDPSIVIKAAMIEKILKQNAANKLADGLNAKFSDKNQTFDLVA